MKFPHRRQVLHLAAGAAALPAVARIACAQSYPTRPVKVIVPFPPGGPTDVMARLVADKLATALGNPFVIENRPGGAGGIVGVKTVVNADPDGYTLLVANVGASLYSRCSRSRQVGLLSGRDLCRCGQVDL
jgi:tripartite-type tricarboxylate transporter receptor subunit TctC